MKPLRAKIKPPYRSRQTNHPQTRKEKEQMMYLKELVAKNGHKIVHYKQATDPQKHYENVFNYSVKYGGTYDSMRYYNNYVIDCGVIHA